MHNFGLHASRAKTEGHGCPLYPGFCIIGRFLSLLPAPQVTEQADHEDQDPTLQSFWVHGAVLHALVVINEGHGLPLGEGGVLTTRIRL